MDPREFHRLAVRLSTGSTPAEFRSAIGRAYYSLFNLGAQHLRSMGFSIGKGAAAHGEVRRCLMNSGDPLVSEVGSDLDDLHSRRNRADYQLDRTDVERPNMAAATVTEVARMIRTLDTAFRGPQRAALQAAITQWRRENGYP
jgi:hypothetical protein